VLSQYGIINKNKGENLCKGDFVNLIEKFALHPAE
jgi:hypothetical protein